MGLRKRFPLLLLGMTLVVGTVGGLMLGDGGLAAPSVWFADGPGGELVRSLRLPRVLAAALVGVALGCAGLLTQSLTRNPLADPGLFGVASGALLAGMIARLVGAIPETVLAWPSIVGALVATIGVLLIGRAQPDAAPETLVVVGVALNAALGGAAALLALVDPQRFIPLRLWLAGSVAGRQMPAVLTSLALVLPVILLVMLLSGEIDALTFGSHQARSWGGMPRVTALIMIVSVAWLTGAATAVAGPIAFIGLAAPHLSRRVVPWFNHTWGIPLTAATGAAIMLIADLVGRVVSSPGEVPVSILVGAFGAPILILFVLAHSRAMGDLFSR